VNNSHHASVCQGVNWGIRLFKLTGLNGSVAIDGRTVTVTRHSGSGKASEKPTTLAAESIKGVSVWTGVTGGLFSVDCSTGASPGTSSPPAEFLSVQFNAGHKEWWDAMAAAIMGVVRRPAPGTGGTIADKAVAGATTTAPQSYVERLNQLPSLDTW